MAVNISVLAGNLTRDPELRYTANGRAVCSFTLATDRPTKEKETDFHRIVVWAQAAESSAQYLKKGHKAVIQGRIQYRSYKDNEGRDVHVTEIIASSVDFVDSGPKTKVLSPEPLETDAEDIEMTIADFDLLFPSS